MSRQWTRTVKLSDSNQERGASYQQWNAKCKECSRNLSNEPRGRRMRTITSVLALFPAAALTHLRASATIYVHTSGQSLSEDSAKNRCRPTEELSDGRLLIYSTSEPDVRLLRQRLIESGEPDQAILLKW